MTEQPRPLQENSLEKNRETLQRWEYKFLYRERSLKSDSYFGSTVVVMEAAKWNPRDLESQVKKLGEEGWELISVVPRSSFGGPDEAGFTTDETWVFKRPKRRVFLPTVQSAERRIEGKKFSPKAHEALKKKGYIIYLLQGKSLEELHSETGEPIVEETQLQEWVNGEWVQRDILGQFWTETSSMTEVAINPSQVVLSKSDDKSFSFHQRMVEEFSEEISKDIKGVKAIIGEASNYVEIALLRRRETGERLFKQSEEFFYTTTKTLWDVSGKFLVEIGEDLEGLRCYKYNLSLQGKRDTMILPLIVPA